MLWICIALFFARVIGQVEVLLLEPDWLPPMSAWYSGLLPYPLLLPAQIALLMLMSVLALRKRPLAQLWRWLALLYFLVMAARLVLCIRSYGSDFYLHGAIPVAFHWVLALFLALLTDRKHCLSRRPLFRAGVLENHSVTRTLQGLCRETPQRPASPAARARLRNGAAKRGLLARRSLPAGCSDLHPPA